MKNTNELAILFKVEFNTYEDDTIAEFVPVDVIEGISVPEERIFIDKNNTPYKHIIDMPENFGYCNRIKIEDLKKQYPAFTPLSLIKSSLFRTSIKRIYRLGTITEGEKNIAPAILVTDKKIENVILFDIDILSYYYEKNPKILKKYIDENIKISEEAPSKEEDVIIDIGAIYKELTSTVINQDEPIKKILTAIWKQKGNFSDSKSRNILINGNTGVGKTEIFRIITKLIDIPCAMVSATQYSATAYVGKNVEDMLTELISRANGDIEKAILIIDEVDKLAQTEKNSSSVNQGAVQEGLLKIIEDGTYTVSYNEKEYNFNTGRLMVIAMGSWTRIELKEQKVVGFENQSTKKTYKDLTKEDLVANGMFPDFIGRFSTIIQMNEHDYQSLLDILNKGKRNILELQTEFLKSKNVELIFEPEAREAVAKKASLSKFGARALDETIENALSLASFEIATNPDVYESLIITKDTIIDNKKYILIKKKKS